MARFDWRVLTPFAATLLLSLPALAQDSDADGTPDDADAFPCDAAYIGHSFAPGEGVFGSLAFEDEWPNGFSDDDFNDAFVAWNFEYRQAPGGNVSKVRAVLHVLALGGTYDLGLGLHLEAPASAVASVTRTVGSVTTNLAPSAADAEATVVVSNNLREFFGGQAGQLNAISGDPVHTTTPIVVEVTFSTPVSLGAVRAPHDLFVFKTATPSHEIHRSVYPGTAQMDATLFGTGIDGSTSNRKFVDTYGTPYALDFPSAVAYPSEGNDIAQVYPDIVGFASSAGQTNTDFYATTVNASFTFAGAQAPVFVAPAAIDTQCVPTGGPSCLAILQGGGSQGDGLYEVDYDGAGPLAPFEVYCDMTTAGGGWTLVEVVKNGYHTTTGATNASALAGRASHAKMSDADIKTLATNGSLQAMMKHPNTIYIQRYSASEWSSFSSRGWRNVTWDSMRSDGTWANNTCNGHTNNRGFSSYSDRNGNRCPVRYYGGTRYMTTWHTYNYSGGVGGAYEVYVR